MPVDIESDLRKWGNSLGVVIPASLAKQYGLKPGQHVHLRLDVDLPRNDASRLAKLDLGWPYGGQGLDELVDEDIEGDRGGISKKGRK